MEQIYIDSMIYALSVTYNFFYIRATFENTYYLLSEHNIRKNSKAPPARAGGYITITCDDISRTLQASEFINRQA